MNPNPHDNDPVADEQAALWAARLDGSVLSSQDRIELEAWLAAAPAHRTLFSFYSQFTADLDQLLPLMREIEDSPEKETAERATARPFPWLSRPIWAGALLTAAAAVALVSWLGRAPTQTRTIATAFAQRHALTLADGTRVELNAQTNIEVALAGGERRVRLTAGQAFFSVAPDATRPFIVETPAGSVRVTGTQFDIRADSPEIFEITVVEGSVQVQPAAVPSSATIALPAGAQFSQGKVHILAPGELDNALAWRTGQIVFDGVSLREALARFARYHGRTIQAADDAAELRVGGRFSLDDLDGFFAALEEVLPVRATRDPSGAIKVSLRTESSS